MDIPMMTDGARLPTQALLVSMALATIDLVRRAAANELANQDSTRPTEVARASRVSG
jgi:hypothetical protein